MLLKSDPTYTLSHSLIESCPLPTDRCVKQSFRSTDPIKVSSMTSASIIRPWREEEAIAPGIEAWTKLKDLRARKSTAENLEQDFTTKGAQGELKCPFAEKARRYSRGHTSSLLRPSSLPTPPGLKEQFAQDPIAVEFHADAFGSPPASAHGSATKCPIRYLDDHSPEEVAKYFENHKHEIPRSHEVCVKRYQSNSESIRQLDAKYGNLVNMIQGLGAKHQPMLPADQIDEEESSSLDQKSLEKIGKWAQNLASSPPPATVEDVEDVEDKSEVRTGHFERPLQEVRLGESPSRPWGIQVPLDKQTAISVNADDIKSNAAQSIAAAVESQIPSDPVEPIKRCPFSHGAPKSPSAGSASRKAAIATEPLLSPARVEEPGPARGETKTGAPSIVFNGPVFFGYSSQSVQDFLRVFQQQQGGSA